MYITIHNNINTMNHSYLVDNNISQFIIRYNEIGPRSGKKITDKLISASSQLEIKNHKKKFRRLDCNETSSVEKIERKKGVQSVHTNADERKQDKEFSRVPIEYMDQRDNGNAADKVRGRVVYRGYAPKNTYFYFKTIKELQLINNENGRQERDYRGEDVSFNSKFESGNLNAAVRINSRQYWLYMREDTNTHGLRQWFYFELKVRKNCKLRLRIYKFSKRFSLYRLGMKPFIRTAQTDWQQGGQKVRYEYDSQQKCFFLEFQYQFEENKETYFATLPPYTCTMLTNYLESISYEQPVSLKRIGTSLSGIDIMAINIVSRKHHKAGQKEKQSEKEKQKGENANLRNTDKHFHPSHNEKQAIIVLSRTHPGQTVSNYALQGFISKLLGTPALTDQYNFYIVPMVNPDGVFLGNHRTGVLGQDLNRNFHAADLEFFPQIETVQNYVLNIQKRHKIAFLFDLHGHSAKKNIFSYGQEAQSGSSRYLFGRIIPKILSNLISTFKYDHCVFKAAKQKKNTARVYFSNKNGINSITFQQSYGLLDVGAIGISHWKNFGSALADSILQFSKFPKENLLGSMNDYLQDEMDKQKLLKQKKQQAKRQKQLAITRTKTNTQNNQEQSARNSVQDLLKKFKIQKSEPAVQVPIVIDEQDSIKSSDDEEELSSGDEDLQMGNLELEMIKKDIVRVGIQPREIYKRQLYNMAQKKVQIGQNYYPEYSMRLHHKQTSMAQRIFKFRSRNKQREFEGIPQAISFRQKGESIQLPYIRK